MKGEYPNNPDGGHYYVKVNGHWVCQYCGS